MPVEVQSGRLQNRPNTMQLEKRVMDQKVNKVREIVKNYSNNEIIMALQYYECDTERTIQAFCEEGAATALNEWKTEGKPRNKPKNKRNKKRGKKPNDTCDETIPPAPVSSVVDSTTEKLLDIGGAAGDYNHPVPVLGLQSSEYASSGGSTAHSDYLQLDTTRFMPQGKPMDPVSGIDPHNNAYMTQSRSGAGYLPESLNFVSSSPDIRPPFDGTAANSSLPYESSIGDVKNHGLVGDYHGASLGNAPPVDQRHNFNGPVPDSTNGSVGNYNIPHSTNSFTSAPQQQWESAQHQALPQRQPQLQRHAQPQRQYGPSRPPMSAGSSYPPGGQARHGYDAAASFSTNATGFRHTTSNPPYSCDSDMQHQGNLMSGSFPQHNNRGVSGGPYGDGFPGNAPISSGAPQAQNSRPASFASYNPRQASSPHYSQANLNDSLNKRRAVEKEEKNLARHDVAVERVQRLFNEEIEKANQRMRRCFQELRQLVNDRESCLIVEMEKAKADGTILLGERCHKARELHSQCGRAPTMTDNEISELKNEIKHFLGQRRFEDELATTLRFEYEPDKLLDLVRNYGEVIPVKSIPQRQNSVSSLPSSTGTDSAISVTAPTSPEERKEPAQPNVVEMGGIAIKSDTMSSEQLADLHRRLQDSLKLKGIASDILPEVAGSAAPAPRRRSGGVPSVGPRGRGGYPGRGGPRGGRFQRRGGRGGIGRGGQNRPARVPELSILEESSGNS